MEIIINSKEFSIFSEEVPQEVVAYHFYNINGTFVRRMHVGESAYPRTMYRIVVRINNKEEELQNGENLYKTQEGKYFIGRKL